jgi:hypothetical protein
MLVNFLQHLILNLGSIYLITIIHLYFLADDLSHITEASSDLNGTRSLLELYKASQVSISEDELVLDSIGTWSGRLLEEQLSSRALQRIPLLREVNT